MTARGRPLGAASARRSRTRPRRGREIRGIGDFVSLCETNSPTSHPGAEGAPGVGAERLAPGGAEAAAAAGADPELRDLERLGRGERGDHELGDAVTGLDLEKPRTVGVE